MKKVIISVIVLILCVGIVFGVKYFLDKDLENQKQELQETINKYGTVEKANVSTLIAKFNTEIKNNDSALNPAMEQFCTVDNENKLYWYGMYEDVSCYVQSVEFTGDKEKDIVDTMAIYCPKDSKNKEMALKYAKNLIKANNNELTDEEVDYLMNEAKAQSPNKKNANNGKGISVGILDAGDHYQYQIVRLYDIEK